MNISIKKIGIVCQDNARLSPVAKYILQDLALQSKKPSVRALEFEDAGIIRGKRVSDSAKGYLQVKGFGNLDLMEIKRIDKSWLLAKDLIFTFDRFLKRAIVYDYFPTKEDEMAKRVMLLNKFVGIKARIRDPGDGPTADTAGVYDLIAQCCGQIIKKFEATLT